MKEYNVIYVKIGDLVSGYVNNNEDGVVALNGCLNVRPPYQREFVYGEEQRKSVINTINERMFIGVFWWARNDNGIFEILDGQQRTISICQYVMGEFSLNNRYFHNLTDEERNAILDYQLMVLVFDGDHKEKLEWFKTINIAGVKLTDQELRNAVYAGEWLHEAKLKFSKTNCVAYNVGDKFVNGSPIRQDYLETALDWISHGDIEGYMAQHQHDKDADELWCYFRNVIDWVVNTFGEDNYRKEMKGLDWGRLYNTYHEKQYDTDELERIVHTLMSNEDVTNKKGVYEYVLSGLNEDFACKLSKRTFSENDKRTAYERQGGVCPITGEKLPIEEMEADHITPHWKGGTTTLDNLQMISKTANKRKGGRIFTS